MVKAKCSYRDTHDIKEIYKTFEKSRKYSQILYTFLLVIFAISSLFLYIKNQIFLLNLFVIGGLFATLLLVSEVIKYESILRTSERVRLYDEHIFTFKDEGIFSDLQGTGYSSSIKFDWKIVSKAVENEQYFLWKYSKPVYNSIRKFEIIEGSAEELRTLFEMQLGNKFVSRVK